MRNACHHLGRERFALDCETLTDLDGVLVEAECKIKVRYLKLDLVILGHFDGYVLHADVPVDDSLAVELVK